MARSGLKQLIQNRISAFCDSILRDWHIKRFKHALQKDDEKYRIDAALYHFARVGKWLIPPICSSVGNQMVTAELREFRNYAQHGCDAAEVGNFDPVDFVIRYMHLLENVVKPKLSRMLPAVPVR